VTANICAYLGSFHKSHENSNKLNYLDTHCQYSICLHKKAQVGNLLKLIILIVLTPTKGL